MELYMDLKNLPGRYSKVSDEMEGSKQAAELLQTQPKSLLTDNRPNVIQDIKTIANRPGFLTWKGDDKPWFNLKGKAKITGKAFDLDTALQQKLEAGIQKQGKPTREFPNVKPLVVEASEVDKDDDKDDDKSELGQAETSNCPCGPWDMKRWLCMTLVFGSGIAAGWWLARRS
jgi:hypothetical protein